MAECYLHNQFPKTSASTSLTLKYYVEYSSRNLLYQLYGDLEENPEGNGEKPPVNTIWICVESEDLFITKIQTVSGSFPPGEPGLCVFWTSEDGLCNRAYVWDKTNETWVNVEVFLFTSEYRWIRFAQMWDGKISDWQFSFSSANGGYIDELDTKYVIMKGGDSRFLSKYKQRISDFDYLEIEGCYATNDMTIGFLNITDTDAKNHNWGIENFIVNSITITADEFAAVDEEKGITVRLPIPKPPKDYWYSHYYPNDNHKYAFYFLGYYVGIFVGSLKNPDDTYASFKSVKCYADLTGVLEAPDSKYKNESRPIGGISRNYDTERN